jgi:hypothetical protein
MSRILNTFLVILTVHDTIAAQLCAVLLLFTLVHVSPPLLDNSKHQTSAIDSAVLTLVTESGMMEDAIDNSVDCAVCIDVRVIPAGDELRNDPFENLRGNLASWLVENLEPVS